MQRPTHPANVQFTSTTTALPEEWNRQALGRLVFLSGLAVVMGLVVVLLDLLRNPNVGELAGLERPTWVIPAGMAVSVAMFCVARWSRLSAPARLDAGLVYLVLTSFLIGVFRHGLPYQADDVLRGFSPVVPLILVIAVLLPVRPARMAIAAAVAAAMDPIALLIQVAGGAEFPPGNIPLWLFVPNAAVVVVAYVVSRVVSSIGKSLTRAREMGAYQLEERLGAGGMGEVWRARHRMLARPAAVKFVRPEVFASGSQSAESILHRFEEEAQATAVLTSPHTVELYDFGIADDGTFYFVLELLEGVDLEVLLLRVGSLPPARVVYLLSQVCHSLRDAHAHGIVHRDIKPANVFICRRGEEFDFVKVLDFGIAQRVESREDATRLTSERVIAGTPAYMAPEAIDGRDADGRADIYSLGCMAYRMLSGRDVFPGGKTPMSVIAAHLEQQPRPLSEVTTQLVPLALEALVMSCLAKDPSERPSSAAEMMDALHGIEGLDETWGSERARAWWEEQEPFAPRAVGGSALTAEQGTDNRVGRSPTMFRHILDRPTVVRESTDGEQA